MESIFAAMCDSAALNPDPTSEGTRSALGRVRCTTFADVDAAGDDEHGAEFYCGDELGAAGEEGSDGARAAALERFDAILQIDAGRFADDEDEEGEEEEKEDAGAGMKS